MAGLHRPMRHDPEEVLAHLRRMSREPFQEALSDLLAAQPEAEELKTWAGKSPDRWAQAVAIFGRLSAFGDKLEIDNRVSYQHRSDAELADELVQTVTEANPELVAQGYWFDVLSLRWVAPGEEPAGEGEREGEKQRTTSPGAAPPQEIDARHD